jgi:glycerophosphoryl diester phosphodiesterase
VPPLITSHAACRGHAPENTLAGIRAALQFAADAIEIDLHCTRDGVPVLIHDETLDRTTDGSGKIADLTLRQARRIDAGGGEQIPSLRDVFKEVDGQALIVLEIKAKNIEQAVLDVVRRAKALDWCSVHSFSPDIVKRIRTLEPRMPCSFLISTEYMKDWDRTLSYALSLNAQGVAPHHSFATAERVRAANLRELRVSTWTANGRDDVRRAAAAGVSAITTDYPDRARRWLPKR